MKLILLSLVAPVHYQWVFILNGGILYKSQQWKSPNVRTRGYIWKCYQQRWFNKTRNIVNERLGYYIYKKIIYDIFHEHY